MVNALAETPGCAVEPWPRRAGQGELRSDPDTVCSRHDRRLIQSAQRSGWARADRRLFAVALCHAVALDQAGAEMMSLAA